MPHHKVNLFGTEVSIPFYLTLDGINSKSELVYQNGSYFADKPLSELKRFYSLYLTTRHSEQLAKKYPCDINIHTLIRKHLPRVRLELPVQCPSCGGDKFSRKISSRSDFNVIKPSTLICCENTNCLLKVNPINGEHSSSCFCNVCIKPSKPPTSLNNLMLARVIASKNIPAFTEGKYYWVFYKDEPQIAECVKGGFRVFNSTSVIKLEELNSVFPSPIDQPAKHRFIGIPSNNSDRRLANLTIAQKRIIQSSVTLSSPTNKHAVTTLVRIMLDIVIEIFKEHTYRKGERGNEGPCSYALAIAGNDFGFDTESTFSYKDINKHGIYSLNLEAALLYSCCLLYENYPDDEELICTALNKLTDLIYSNVELRKNVIKPCTGSATTLRYLSKL